MLPGTPTPAIPKLPCRAWAWPGPCERITYLSRQAAAPWRTWLQKSNAWNGLTPDCCFCARPCGVCVRLGPHASPGSLLCSGALGSLGSRGADRTCRCHSDRGRYVWSCASRFSACRRRISPCNSRPPILSHTEHFSGHSTPRLGYTPPSLCPAPVAVQGPGEHGSSHGPRNIGPGAAATLRHVEKNCCDHPVFGQPLRPAAPGW